MVTMRSGWVRFGGQRAQQRRLAGIGAARDDHVQPGPHCGAQEAGQLVGQRIGQVVEGGVDQAVTSDRHARAVRHLDHGREPVPTGEVEVDDGLGAVDPALSPGVVRPGGSLDQLDEVFVAVRDRLDPLFDSVGAFHPHVVAAVDVDVLDVVLVEEELEAAETQLGGHQAADDLLLLLGTRRGHAALDHGAGGFVDGLAGELLDEGAAIAFAHSRRAVVDDPVGDVLGGVGLELPAFGVVHLCAFPFDPAPTGTAESEVCTSPIDSVGVSTSTGGGTTRRCSSGTAGSMRSVGSPASTGAGSSMPTGSTLRASMPSAPTSVLAHLRSAVRSSRVMARLLASASAAFRSSGIGGPDVDPEGLPDLGPRIAPRAGGDDQERSGTHLGHQAGKGGSEMDDPLERRIAQDDQDIAVCEHVADAAGEVRKEPAGVDDHVGVEGAQRLRDGGPGLLVGHGALRRWRGRRAREGRRGDGRRGPRRPRG